MQGGLEEPGRIPFEPAEPAGVTVGFARADRSLAKKIESDEIDARVTARTPSTFRRSGSAVRRLFEHPFEVERDYFRRTGIFPIMHTLVIRKDPRERIPGWRLPVQSVLGSQGSGDGRLTQTSALHSVYRSSSSTHTRPGPDGQDFWPYGLESNRRTFSETFVRYMHEQGLIPRTDDARNPVPGEHAADVQGLTRS